MLKIDLHVHTWYSDARSTVSDVLEAAKRRGLDGIAITDHHTMQGVWDAKGLLSDFFVVPGIEVTTRDGHLLGLGLRANNLILQKTKDLSALQVSRMIHEAGGLVVVPHPCTPFFSMKPSVIEQISPDAIEVFNAHSPFFARDARQSTTLAQQLRIPIVAGSDSHTWQTVGDAYTLIDAKLDIDDVLHAIRRGHTLIAGSASPWKYRLPIFKWMTSQPMRERILYRRPFLSSSFSTK